MMNKALKTKWIKALRSGKYTQTEWCLNRHDADGNKSFCCLGVLQEIGTACTSAHDGLLVPESCGISEEVQITLAKYNDDGKSFAWIASNIERRKTL